MKRQIKCRNAAVMEPGCSWGRWQGQGVQQPLEEGAEGCSQLRGGMAMGCSRKEQWEPKWMEHLRSPSLLRGQPDRHSPHAREGDYPSALGCGTSFPSPPKLGCCFLPLALAPTSRRHHRIQPCSKQGMQLTYPALPTGKNNKSPLFSHAIYQGQHIGGDWSIALGFLIFFHHPHADSTLVNQAIPKVQCPPHRHFVFHQDLIQTGAATPDPTGNICNLMLG